MVAQPTHSKQTMAARANFSSTGLSQKIGTYGVSRFVSSFSPSAVKRNFLLWPIRNFSLWRDTPRPGRSRPTLFDRLSRVHLRKTLALVGAIALLTMITIVKAQPPAALPQTGAPPARGAGGGRGGGRGSRFKIYPRMRSTADFQPTIPPAATAMGERGKGGKAGPDLIASVVTLHDEDGVDIAKFVRAPEHSKIVKIDASGQSDRRYRRLPAFARDLRLGSRRRSRCRSSGGRREGRGAVLQRGRRVQQVPFAHRRPQRRRR